jgi:hypothetical protein
MSRKSRFTTRALTATVSAAALTAGLTMATAATASAASARPEGDLWNLVNNKHVSAGCASYGGSQALEETAVDIAKYLVHPPSGPSFDMSGAESRLEQKGYYPNGLGQANYLDSASHGSPQNAMDFWLNHQTRGIFPNCGLRDMAAAVWIENGKWAAVVLAATPGSPPPPPIVK